MTSKALEAAVDAALDLNMDVTASEVADIIRAFAKNLSEEAIAAGKSADSRGLHGHERQGAGDDLSAKTIRAAIEKDLE